MVETGRVSGQESINEERNIQRSLYLPKVRELSVALKAVRVLGQKLCSQTEDSSMT